MVNIELDYFRLLQISSALRLLIADAAKRGISAGVLKEILTLMNQFEVLTKQEEPKPES